MNKTDIKIVYLPSEYSNTFKVILNNDFIIWMPNDESNPYYQEYLQWLDEGNTPEPADEAE